MFDFLSSKMNSIFTAFGKKSAVSEEDLDKVLRELRITLLEADVALPVVQKLFNEIKEEATGAALIKSISPKQLIVKIVHDKLQQVLSQTPEETAVKLPNRLVTIMLFGLQGVGKTTTCAKLGHYLGRNFGRQVVLVSLDLNRAAAYTQLQNLAKQNNLGFFEYSPQDYNHSPLLIAQAAKRYAEEGGCDTLIVDTAGRTNISAELMSELKELDGHLKPEERILVADSMLGQVSVKMAQDFNEFVKLSGLILTKMEGNGRGGALLSIKYITGIPVKFVGVGEQVEDLEIFSSQRIADRILQMGDVVTLVEKVSQLESDKEIKGLGKRLAQGIFTMDDFKKQLESLLKIGGIGTFMGFIPGLGRIKDKLSAAGIDNNLLKQQIAIINSMTKEERKKPDIFNGSRKKRVAQGSGVGVDKVNRLIKQYEQSFKMLKKFKQGKLKDLTELGKINNNL